MSQIECGGFSFLSIFNIRCLKHSGALPVVYRLSVCERTLHRQPVTVPKKVPLQFHSIPDLRFLSSSPAWRWRVECPLTLMVSLIDRGVKIKYGIVSSMGGNEK